MTANESERNEDDRIDLQRLSNASRSVRSALLDRVLTEATRDAEPDEDVN